MGGSKKVLTRVFLGTSRCHGLFDSETINQLSSQNKEEGTFVLEGILSLEYFIGMHRSFHCGVRCTSIKAHIFPYIFQNWWFGDSRSLLHTYQTPLSFAGLPVILRVLILKTKNHPCDFFIRSFTHPKPSPRKSLWLFSPSLSPPWPIGKHHHPSSFFSEDVGCKENGVFLLFGKMSRCHDTT